jgi:sialic acid synthase SpsE
MLRIKIGNKYISETDPLYFIADIAANHDGDINRAFKLIELAKEAGADAAKFQNFQAEKIVSRHGFETMNKDKMSHQSAWKKSVFEVYKDASVPFDWTQKLKKKCDEVGIEYFTSPYDFEAVDYVDPYVNVHKVGSGDITWIDMIEYIAKKGKPVMLAAGASTITDVERAMKTLQKHTKDIVLMQCNTNYTASKENFKHINLNVLITFKDKYPNVILGLSDHTHGHSTVLGAIALGARVFEKHFTDDNNRTGPDHKFAMNPQTWRDMVDRANELYLSLGDGKKIVEGNEKDTIVVQRRALRYAKNLSKGQRLSKSDIFPLRPCPADGIQPYEIDKVIGKIIKTDVKNDDLVRWSDFK